MGENLTPNEQDRLRGKAILLVDDNKTVLRHGSFFLLAQGAEVLTSENGQEALEVIQRRVENNDPPFDLIVTDYEMPGVNGKGLLEALAKDKLTKEIPVIFTSAKLLTREDKEHLLGYPQVRFVLKKPIQSEELIEVIQKALE